MSHESVLEKFITIYDLQSVNDCTFVNEYLSNNHQSKLQIRVTWLSTYFFLLIIIDTYNHGCEALYIIDQWLFFYFLSSLLTSDSDLASAQNRQYLTGWHVKTARLIHIFFISHLRLLLCVNMQGVILSRGRLWLPTHGFSCTLAPWRVNKFLLPREER